MVPAVLLESYNKLLAECWTFFTFSREATRKTNVRADPGKCNGGVLRFLTTKIGYLLNFNNGYLNKLIFDEYDFYVYGAWASAWHAANVDYRLELLFFARFLVIAFPPKIWLGNFLLNNFYSKFLRGEFVMN